MRLLLLLCFAPLLAIVAATPATDNADMISSRPSGEALVARRAAYDSASLTKRLMGWPIMQLMTWRLFAQFGTEKEAKERPDASANNTTVPMLLKFRNDTAPPHEAVGSGTELRILPLGDSITVGWLSDTDGGDGDGYRRQLRHNLSRNNKVAYAGTVRSGSLKDGYYAAWSGQTIQFIAEHAAAALAQRPNVVLLMAGTNDMNPDPRVSRQGHDPAQAAARLGTLIDMIVGACPDAVLLVAVIPGTCNADQAPQTEVLQGLIPGVAARRREAGGKQVLAVDFGGDSFGVDLLRDCIHPTNEGYRIMGDYWSDFIQQVPAGWIREPVGADPVRSEGSSAWRAALSMLAWACKWKSNNLFVWGCMGPSKTR